MSHGSSPLLCGARLSNGRGFCRARALTGKLRCQFHGGRSTGPRTAEGKRRTVEAMVEGRARWIAEMRKLKASGLIEKIPGGRRPNGQPRKTGDKIIDRARMVVADRMAETVEADLIEGEEADAAENGEEMTLPVPAGTWERMSDAAKLRALTGMSFNAIRDILDMKLPDDKDTTAAHRLKLLSIQKDAALSVLSTQVRVDVARLHEHRSDKLGELLELIKKYSQEPKLIERATEIVTEAQPAA